ncbi:phospholipase a2-alpha [Phtheirospermum japonicum]|uniref:phospholipase A2 n=1 Tax=Phtheirospermum japonicum TaxID=374723 RepID=A0A830CH56_9LAMI|nr:phospholipase a2-alpha [Phtheirospermum japonicum]
MAYSQHHTSKLASPLPFLLIITTFAIPIHALNIGLHTNAGLKLFKECSRTCESMFCDAAPFLRYGKYCGLLYSGCPGEQPCDRLDACCMHHDQCIAKMGNDYLSQKCNKEFLSCVEAFRKSGAPSFKGNTCEAGEVVKTINNAMRAAIVAGKVFGKP